MKLKLWTARVVYVLHKKQSKFPSICHLSRTIANPYLYGPRVLFYNETWNKVKKGLVWREIALTLPKITGCAVSIINSTTRTYLVRYMNWGRHYVHGHLKYLMRQNCKYRLYRGLESRISFHSATEFCNINFFPHLKSVRIDKQNLTFLVLDRKSVNLFLAPEDGFTPNWTAESKLCASLELAKAKPTGPLSLWNEWKWGFHSR